MHQDTPIVHQRPHSQTKMQARFAFAEAFLMFVPISIPVEAPHVQALSASILCNSDDVHLPVVACKAPEAKEQKQKGTPLVDGAWLELNSLPPSPMPIASTATQGNPQVPLTCKHDDVGGIGDDVDDGGDIDGMT